MDASTSRSARFLAVFAAVFFPAYYLLSFIPLDPLTVPTAHAQIALLQAVGVPATVDYDVIRLTPDATAPAYRIGVECSGLVMSLLYVALLLATPLSQDVRLREGLLGVLVLMVFNQARLWLTLVAGALGGTAVLDAAHLAFWIVDALLVLALWARAARVPLY